MLYLNIDFFFGVIYFLFIGFNFLVSFFYFRQKLIIFRLFLILLGLEEICFFGSLIKSQINFFDLGYEFMFELIILVWGLKCFNWLSLVYIFIF